MKDETIPNINMLFDKKGKLTSINSGGVVSVRQAKEQFRLLEQLQKENE